MAERPVLEAVLLDAGGTLVRLDFEWIAEDLDRHGFRTDSVALRRGEIEGRRRYDASVRPAPRPGESPPLGSVGDVRAYLGGMLVAVGAPQRVIEAAVPRLLARERERGLWARPMEGARETIDGLEALGLRRAVVSNSDGRAEWHLENSGVRAGIEFVVDSHVVGVEKPDPRILGIALERLGVASERAIYVGDIRAVDEAVACAAGVHFVLIDPFGDYAGPETPAIRNIGDLPAWLGTRFRVPVAPGSQLI